MSTKTDTQQIQDRAVALIGLGALKALHDAGFAVADRAALAQYLDEHQQDLGRLRDVAAAAMESAGTTAVRCELKFRNGVGHIIVTHPAGDEEAMGRRIARLMYAMHDHKGRKPYDPDTVETCESTDVAVATAPPADGNAEGDNQRQALRDAGAENPLRSIAVAMSCVRDWGADPADAWLFGVVMGWGTQASIDDVTRAHGWAPQDVERLRRLHAAYQKAMVELDARGP